MADGSAFKAPVLKPSDREASPPPAILPLIDALVDIMVREEQARQEAEREGKAA